MPPPSISIYCQLAADGRQTIHHEQVSDGIEIETLVRARSPIGGRRPGRKIALAAPYEQRVPVFGGSPVSRNRSTASSTQALPP